MRRIVIVVAAGLGWCAGACSPTSEFTCAADDECGADGTCQADVGYCSFPDTTCPSEQRYGEHAGGGLAGTCVGEAGTGTSGPAGTSTTSDDVGDVGDSTGVADACGPTSECVPVPPAEWSGPVLAIASATERPNCPDDAPVPVRTGHGGLVADEAICECACDATNTGCDVELFVSLSGACGMDFGMQFSEGECAVVPLDILPGGGSVVLPMAFDGCTPVSSETVPPTTWSDHVQLCESEAAACDEGICAPTPDPLSGAAACIWREGEHSCPLSGYTQAFVFHEGVDDSRACAPCDCGRTPSCIASVHADSMCGTAPLYSTNLDVEQCIDFDAVLPEGTTGDVGVVVNSEAGNRTGECTAARGGVPVGAATETGTFTVCCRA